MALGLEFVIDHLNKFSSSLGAGKEMIEILIENNIYEDDSAYYLCPLCCDQIIYAKKSHEGYEIRWSTTFTKDHYPPQSVGGNKTILVCQRCNNTAGMFESELSQYIHYINFHKKRKGSTLTGSKGKFEGTADGPYPVTLSLNDEGVLDMAFHNKKNYLLLINKMKEFASGAELKMEISIKVPDPLMVRKAILKTLYLYCFDMWGYGFAFSDAGKGIRNVIWNNADYPLQDGITNLVEENLDKLPVGPVVILWEGLKTLAINIPIKMPNGYECVLGTPIPQPEDGNFEIMKKLLEENRRKVYRGGYLSLIPPDLSKYFFGYQEAWADLLDDTNYQGKFERDF